MLDKNRILSKLDELDSYLSELEIVMPKSYEEYVGSIEKKEILRKTFAHSDRMCDRCMRSACERFEAWSPS